MRRTWVERGAVAAFFLVVAGFALLVYDDYGISWDEPGLVDYGNLLLDHFAPGGAWETYGNLRFYGPVGPVLLAATDRLTEGPPFPAGHLANFAVYLAGAGAFYALCRYQFRSRLWGLAGAAALVLSPRLFSHGMVNPKDMPLMVMSVVAVYLLTRFLESRNLWWLAGCGVATALAIATRIVGAFLIPLVLLGIGLDALARRRERAFVRSSALAAALFVGVAAGVAYVLWPFLWESPVGHLREALDLMANFDEGPSVALYHGDVRPVADLPWHYVPGWIWVTTPPLYLLLGVAGIAVVAARLIRRRIGRDRDRFFVVHLAWLLVPLAGLAILRPPLYDDWRQVLFVYPALLLCALAGARAAGRFLIARRPGRAVWRGVAVLGACAAVWLIGPMFRLHPYQGTYFNVFAGGDPAAAFEADYWGLSYAEGQERLLNSVEGDIHLYTCGGAGVANEQLLAPEDAERLEYLPTLDGATHSLCAPRPSSLRPVGELMFTIERDGVLLLEALRLP